MALQEGDKINFRTLRAAAKAGRLALLECREKATGKIVSLIVAVNRNQKQEYCFVPLAQMIDGDPYELFEPPSPDGGFLST